MKQVLIGLVVGIGAALLSAPHAEASSFMTITVGLASVTCNNSTAASLAACPAGFTSAVGANFMDFTGLVGGYFFGGAGTNGIQLTSNGPGTAGMAETIDTKTSVMHLSGTDPAVLDYGANNFCCRPVWTNSRLRSRVPCPPVRLATRKASSLGNVTTMHS